MFNTALTSIKNYQANVPVEQLHQVIINMIVTKDIDNKVFYYIYPWGETLAYIAWLIQASYKCTIMATPGQSVFGRDMLFNLASVVDWWVVTAAKQCQVDIDIFREKARQIMHDFAIVNPVYVEMTGIYRKLDYKGKGLYRFTELFKNGTGWFQWGQVNEWINIVCLNTHFDE